MLHSVAPDGAKRAALAARLSIFLVLTLLAGTAGAIQPIESGSHAPPGLSRPFVEPALQVQPELEATVRLDARMAVHPAAASFQARHGGEWEMRWDRRSDRPNFLQGSGIPLWPGRGNDLAAASIGAAGDVPDLDTVERVLRDFIAQNDDLLGTAGLEFRLDPQSTVQSTQDPATWFVEFAQFHEGIPVEGAHLFFRVSHGNLVQFGSERVAPVTEDIHPASGVDAAFDLAWQELAFSAGTELVEWIDPGSLQLLPTTPNGTSAFEPFLGTAGTGYAHRLAWRFVFRVAGDITTYEAIVDAHTNRVMEVRNLTLNVDATVTAGIYPTTNTDPEIVVPMPYVTVTNGGTKITDVLGIYDYSGGTATATLNGQFFRMSDNCGSISLSNGSDGNLAFGTSGGTDCTTPGVGGAGNTHASRTGFYHLTNINRKAINYLPGNSWLASKVTANMNIDDTCNAYWSSGTLNFFKSGTYQGTFCSNTGEIAAVFLHEWGHGMDSNSGGAASEYGSGEAVGDTFAFLETKDACIGENFTPGIPCHNCDASCTGVRDVEAFSTRGAAVIATPANITDNGGPNCDRWACPYYQQGIFPYQGPMGYEGHCESYIASSANWDLAQSLVDEYGAATGWQEMDRIWYDSLTPSKSAYRVASGGQCNINASIDGCGSSNWYTVYLAADDDDGNLANGTPNGCRIWDAFQAHGIACGARPACTASGVDDFGLQISNPSQSLCAPGSTTYSVDVLQQGSFSAPVTLAATGLPPDVSAAFSPNPVTPGTSSTLTLTAGASSPAGSHGITINGSASGSPGHSAGIELIVTSGSPDAPTPTAPADGASGVTIPVPLSWSASANATSYTVEIATDLAFSDIVVSQSGITGTSYAADGLGPATTFYWRVRADNDCGSSANSAARSFTTANVICSTPNIAIPDGSASGTSDSITIQDSATLASLKVSIKATHTYVGDLQFSLSNGSGTVMMIDRPGYTGSGYGCSGDNVDVTLDDDATQPVESQCNGTPPALSGNVQPNNPIDATFAGQSLGGTWTLRAYDRVNSDSGTLDEWCLIPETVAGTDHTVGGTVGGLAGSGLVLSLNGGAQTLPIAANGAFTFPTALPSGSPYAVTVATQPSNPTQVCTVTNGSGTVGGTDITNVSVACTTSTFTVGGTVGGLAGSGLVLSLNGGAQTLPIAANGAFTFPTALPSGSPYAVTVATQPSNPTQVCTVTNGSGTVGGTDITNVSVACTTSTFTVGGTVGGLLGNEVTLSLNGGEQTLIVGENGTFAFATPLPSGAAYDVAAAKQPTDPIEHCTVENGSGTIGASDVDDILVTCSDRIFADGFED